MKQSLSEKLSLAFRFEFEHDGHNITANASGINGKEEVLVNGEPVSKKRSLGFSSRHDFVVDGTEYELHFKVRGFMLSRLECRLVANGNEVATKTHSAFANKKITLRNFILFFLGGMVFGYLAATIALEFMG